MTHEELKKHKGTVWSCAGLGHPAEYQYIETMLDSREAIFKRLSDGDIVSLPTVKCHRTERDCIEREIIAVNLEIAAMKAKVGQFQRRLDDTGDKP